MSRALIAGAILGAGLISGGLLIQSGAWREASATTREEGGSARLLEQVMARLGSDYVDSLSVDELYRRTALGFVKELDDPYSVLLAPDRYRRLLELTSGKFAGIGVELDMRDGFVTVIAPLAGTPADSAGIRPGDRVIAVNGTPTHGLTMEEAQASLRGAPGTRVKLSLERGDAHPVLTLTRREIVFHPVQRAELVNGAAYVALATFSENAATELRRAVDSLRAAGGRSLILDMRVNPGGLLEQGIAVADLFLDAGQTIVSTRGRIPEADHVFTDESAQRWAGMPIVVLVDSGSASASEIVAGALKDHHRAVLVGTRTYGKGSAQSVFPVNGGYALKLTTARWFTPNGTTIERDSTTGGIEPDVTMKPPAAAPFDSTRTVTRRVPLAADPMVARALELLSGVSTPAALRARVSKTT
jgi:carboxyl-terminal processing protease